MGEDAKMWYLSIAGQIQGPMGAEDIVSKLKSGAVNCDTVAFSKGIVDDWTPLEEIPQFASASQHVLSLPPVPSGVSDGLSDVIDYNIFGDDIQFLEVELDPGESAIAEAGAMMYMEDDIKMQTIFGDGSSKSANEGWWGVVKSAGKRILTGESLFITMFTHAGQGKKAKVAFAAPYPGKIIPVNLREVGGTLICQKEAFLCGAKGVSVGIAFQKKIGVGFFGGEGFIMQKLEGDGLVFCHAGGTIMCKDLLPGQTLRVDTGCVVAYQSSVNFDVQFSKDIKSAFFGGEGFFFATLTGPGRIWLQSIPFSRFATRIFAAAKQSGGHKEEGSVLSGVFNLIGGKD